MGKGGTTRVAIVDVALRVAATEGIEQLTIGSLAREIGMSKSGLYAHFESREELQLEVLKTAVDRFTAQVVLPAFQAPRGEPRVKALFDNWLAWSQAQPGGCLIHSASSELDDRPGPLRDFLEKAHFDLRETIVVAARKASEQGHFRPGLDCEQFAFEFAAIALGFHHASRLLRDRRARDRAELAFQALAERARTPTH